MTRLKGGLGDQFVDGGAFVKALPILLKVKAFGILADRADMAFESPTTGGNRLSFLAEKGRRQYHAGPGFRPDFAHLAAAQILRHFGW